MPIDDTPKVEIDRHELKAVIFKLKECADQLRLFSIYLEGVLKVQDLENGLEDE